MVSEDEIPEWCVVGAEVVEVTESRHGIGGRIEPTTVKTVGKRDVVLASGSRYRRRSVLARSTGEWSPNTQCVPEDDPLVLRVRVENLRSHRWLRVARAFEMLQRSKETPKASADAAALVDAARLYGQAVVAKDAVEQERSPLDLGGAAFQGYVERAPAFDGWHVIDNLDAHDVRHCAILAIEEVWRLRKLLGRAADA